MIQVTHAEESSESTQQRSVMQSANFTTKDTTDSSGKSSGKYNTKSLKCFQLYLVREVMPGERWSEAETYSHARTALSKITFSLWNLALQSKLITFSGKLWS